MFEIIDDLFIKRILFPQSVVCAKDLIEKPVDYSFITGVTYLVR